MTSPTRSVAVRLSLDPSSYLAGTARAEASTVSLERAVSKVGPTSATSMERAAASTAKAEGAFGKLNKTAGALGLTMGGLAGVGAAVGAAMSVKWAGDYQSALTRLVTTAGESPRNIKAVGQAFLDMAGQVGISADEIAKGAYTAESAGFHGAAAVTVMKAATQGARQENADLGKVVNATTTILHDYHLGADQAARVTSQLITAVSHGKVSFDELTGALDAITPLAARANISIADVTGTLAAMTASGMSADQATQNMQNTLLHLVNPTGTMIAELSQLGVSTDDLAKSMSTNGLAGTLQMVEEAIVKHIDPATQRVLLPALNKSKSAAADLQVMLGQMPGPLAKLSRGLMDGTTSFKEYRKAVQDLGGQSSAMGKQFLSLYESSQGFNNVLKAGGPNAQVFTAAMAKAFGTTSALNVALQTTGENAGATNAAIKDIANAAGDAEGNIKGWDEVQGNFNQQLAQAEAHMKSMAIEAGQHLLPMLTTAFGYVNHDVLPGLEHLGAGAMDAAHWWSQLPGPIKDVSLALAGLALAQKIGLIDRFGAGVGGVRTAFAGLRDEMAVQQRLWAMNQQSAIEAGRSYGEMERALGGFGLTARTAAAGATQLEGKLSTIAVRGMAGLKAGATGLMNLFGGPWGVALGAGTLAVSGLVHWLQQDHDIVPKVTVDTQGLTSAIEANNGAIDGNVRRQAAMALQQAGLFKAAQAWGVSFSTLTDAALGNKEAIAQVNAAQKQYHDAAMVAAKDTGNLSYGAGILGDAAYKVAKQSDAWASALAGVTGKTEGQIAQQRQINEAVGAGAAATGAATDSTNKYAAAAQRAGADVAQVWGNNTVVLRNATGAQIDDLEKLGGVVTHLPNHQVVVSANTQAARDAITRLTNDYHNYSINLGVGGIGGRYAAASGAILPGFTPGRDVHHFTSPGGIHLDLSGGEGIARPEVVQAMGPGRFMGLNAAARAGGVDGVRKALGFAAGGVLPDWSLTAKVGISPSSLSAAERAIKSALSFAPGVPGNVSANAALGRQMAARYYGWTGPEWNALYALWNRESGWRNTAQNPTSTAYGIPQFLDSTWATVGLSKSSNPAVQIAGGLKYIDQRFHDPIGAWAHETRYGWYRDGTDFVPFDMPAMLHRGEAVVPATENARQRSREVVGNGYSGSGSAANGGGLGDVTVIAQFGDETIEAKAVRVVNGRLNDWYRKKAHR